MKNLLLLLLVSGVAFSCNRNEDSEEYPQKWTLVKTVGQDRALEFTGEDMMWQEYYLLNAGGTFIKHREKDGTVLEASGSYAFTGTADAKMLELTFDVTHEIIATCDAGKTEYLSLKSDSTLESTWTQCDGPGLEYKLE